MACNTRVWLLIPPLSMAMLFGCSQAHGAAGPVACGEHELAEEGDGCDGEWTCESAIDGSTARHFTERSCVDGEVAVRFWSVPYASLEEPDASAMTADTGAPDAGQGLDSGPADAGQDSSLCRAVCDHACGTPFGDELDCRMRCEAGTSGCGADGAEQIRACLRDWCDGLYPCIDRVECVDR